MDREGEHRGPKPYCLLELMRFEPNVWDEPPGPGKAKAVFERVLLFAVAFRTEVAPLVALLRESRRAAPANSGLSKRLEIMSVARWIHNAVHIESTGYGHESDTDAVFRGLRSVEGDQHRSRHVENATALLKEAMPSRGSTLVSRILDIDGLKAWHKTALRGILGDLEVGCWRGSDSDWAGGYGSHHYPHYSLVPSAIQTLLEVARLCACHIECTYDVHSLEYVMFVFALASFVQFHLIDIHPFADGNGLLACFVSMHILELLCPLPFPMFRDRKVYETASVTGRSAQPERAPEHLLALLFASAIAHYDEVRTLVLRSREWYVIASSEDELSVSMDSAGVPVEHRAQIAARFALLTVGDGAQLTLDDCRYQLLHMFRIGTRAQ